MPRKEDIARQETREFLASLRDGLGQPPIGALLAGTIIALVRLLGEQDIGKRLASRDRLAAMLAELDGGGDPPLITRPHDWPHDQ
jgi:hypothetical protein